MSLAYAPGSADTVTHAVAARVRDRLREEQADPSRDRERASQIAWSEVRRHNDFAPARGLELIDDEAACVRDVLAAVAGYGPLQALLDDPTIEEIWINAPDRVYVARHGRSERAPVVLTEAGVRDLVERMLHATGRRVDLSQPFVDAMLPAGHRLHVVLDGISRGFAAVNIRKFVARAHSLDDLVVLGTLDQQAADFLRASVLAGLNIVVSGGTQAGKTTLLNCLAAAIPGTQRLLSAEEVFELQCGHPDWVALQTRQAGLEGTGEIDLRVLVKEALRMRPSRLIIGEVRAAECLDLLLALNAGLPGMASIHANSARQALVKMCTLPLLAGENIGSRFVVPTVAASVDLVIHTAMDATGARRVSEIVSVTGRIENDLIEAEPVFVRRGHGLERAHGVPVRREAFDTAGIDLESILGARRWVE